jgi:hypothetical protein
VSRCAGLAREEVTDGDDFRGGALAEVDHFVVQLLEGVAASNVVYAMRAAKPWEVGRVSLPTKK